MMKTEIIIVGAGAAGLFCAALLGQKGFRVTVIDNGKRAGRKIIMSGGGRCNFTNLSVSAKNYLSSNPHFCKSALSRFTPWDFIHFVEQYKIPYQEREHGQLFCQNSAQEIVDMLLSECDKGHVNLMLNTELIDLDAQDDGFEVVTSNGKMQAKKVIVATGGLSMPKLGSSSIGYKIAEKFGLSIVPVRAGLVPFTLHKPLLDVLSTLSGVAVPIIAAAENGVSFEESLLFTHRGLSGPVMLQLSNYWQPGEMISLNLLPSENVHDLVNTAKQHSPNQLVKTMLAPYLPKRLLDCLQQLDMLPDCSVKQLIPAQIDALSQSLHQWQIYPNSTEGYRTAEVTLGGIDTQALSSKSMAVKHLPNLYFIGEVVDVTGWLGGYNFHWAWSSAWACAAEIHSL